MDMKISAALWDHVAWEKTTYFLATLLTIIN